MATNQAVSYPQTPTKAWGGWLLLVTFVVALAVFFFLAASGRPGPVVTVAFALYVAAGTLLVQRQYLGWVEGNTAQPPLSLGASLFVLGAAGLGLGWWMLRPTEIPSEARDNGDIVLLVGILVLYLGAGLLIMSLRGRVARRPDGLPTKATVGCVTGTVALLVLAGVGLWKLGEWPTLRALPFVAALLLIPFFVGVLSEAAIEKFTGDSDEMPTRTRLLGAVGSVLLFGAFVWTAFDVREESRALAILVLIVVSALIAALASSTFADIAAVLAAVALLGVTPAPQEPPDGPTEASKHVFVALGDSYLSGEGAQSYIDGTDKGRGENECRRSTTSWAAQVGSRAPYDGLIFLACSGARSYNLWTSGSPDPKAQEGEGGTQLARYNDFKEKMPGLVPDLVVLSLGGNDAGFADIGTTCLLGGDCNDAVPSRLNSPANLGRVERRLDTAYAEVRTAFEGSPVVVIPYPDPFDASAPCAGVPLGEGDVDLIEELLPALNSVVQGVAEKYGFYYPDDMSSALATDERQLCGNNQPGLNFVALRSVQGLQGQRFNPQEWYHNSLHPNELGHESLERAFLRWLETEAGESGAAGLDSPQERVPTVPTPTTLPDEDPVDSDEDGAQDCTEDYTKEDPSGCHGRAVQWALGETGADVLRFSPVLGSVALGAWLLSTFLFAWRRVAARRRAATAAGA